MGRLRVFLTWTIVVWCGIASTGTLPEYTSRVAVSGTIELLGLEAILGWDERVRKMVTAT